MQIKEISIVYRFKNSLYINLTNRCPNLCVFCIKSKWEMRFEGYNLNLEGKEPSAQEVVAKIHGELAKASVEQIVFCGYGEPTVKLPVLTEICDILNAEMKEGKIGKSIIRLNTIGLGNKIWGRDIVPDLQGRIKQIYISLNSNKPEQWAKLVRPAKGYEDGFESVVGFIKNCIGKFDKVVVSTVEGLGVDTQDMGNFVKELGAEFYVRSFLDDEN
ncbi:Radical SAM domain protein [Elusimicrobium minutum Pei191]|uniref:Radical SAM domain protein n=1 Tax=Elusimicrobium minutum (strain Pei191) TaxID=445932 RepID=B2KDW5_ELUMP|nr:TatD family nuclease-associated radical SAM protein [Elusimicrobium minutum]ACC98711.1 Radical SAM domain protein [Elusimicrobium minutum Pei191]